MSEGYHPEIDDTPPCTNEDSVKYRSMIGCYIYLTVQERFDIANATYYEQIQHGTKKDI
jgi:hypothetical protein